MPFNFCEKENPRKFSTLDPISSGSLKSCMQKLTFLVEEKVKKKLPDQFAIAFDGWSESSTHYLAVFAVFSDSNNKSGYEKVLLAFAPLIHDEDLSADSHHETLFEILKSFGKNFSNIAGIIGDNCSVNQSLARKCKCYLVGCASHRLNLSIQKYLDNFTFITDAVRNIIISLRTIKNRAALKKVSPLSPVLDNVTRWSSKFEMLQRYSKLQDHITDIVPVKLQLGPVDNETVQTLLKNMAQLDSLTKFLQSEERQMYEVREVFDKSIEFFDCLKHHCAKNAPIVFDPEFEAVVCKIQQHQIGHLPLKLAPSEAKYVKHLKVQNVTSVLDRNSDSDCADVDEMTAILHKLKRAKVLTPSPYIDLRFIRPTSNICECLFSMSKFALPDNRKRLNPANLEMQLFLKVNRHLWDIELMHSEME